jgi:hypothetical protein
MGVTVAGLYEEVWLSKEEATDALECEMGVTVAGGSKFDSTMECGATLIGVVSRLGGRLTSIFDAFSEEGETAVKLDSIFRPFTSEPSSDFVLYSFDGGVDGFVIPAGLLYGVLLVVREEGVGRGGCTAALLELLSLSPS